MRYVFSVRCMVFLGVVLGGCGDPGYSFDEQRERIDLVEPHVTAYCLNALACVPRVYQDSLDACRVAWLQIATTEPVVGAESTRSCDEAARQFFDCGAQASCLDFPGDIYVPPPSAPPRTDLCGDQARVFAECLRGKEAS